MNWLVVLSFFFLALVMLYFLRFGRQLLGIWKEPVLRYPVVIFESDDWGPGPESEAQSLRQLANVLAGYRDNNGRYPVMTLGMVLSIPDGLRIQESNGKEYHARRLDDPMFSDILDAIQEGMEKRVFDIQLHGMAHYLPQTVLKASRSDPLIRKWLNESPMPDPWYLPSALQSRWVDGSELPSLPLDRRDSRQWAAEEVAAFKETFGFTPLVAVPPTFVWTPEVEAGWAEKGVRYVVTPGQWFSRRGGEGQPLGQGSILRNGQGGTEPRISYIVRNDYFEPEQGHTADRAVQAAKDKWTMRRPTLFETHRFNFNGTIGDPAHALRELSDAVNGILDELPQTRFLSTRELGDILQAEDPAWLDTTFFGRLRFFLLRARLEMPLIRRILPV